MRCAKDLSFSLEIETVVMGIGTGTGMGTRTGMGMASFYTEPEREPAQGLSPYSVVCLEWVRPILQHGFLRQ